MRNVIWTAGILLLAVACACGQQLPINTLTPQEVTEGWILLFDGRELPLWIIEGDYEVRDGALVLGGHAEPTRALLKANFKRKFSLHFEYSQEGTQPVKAGVLLRHSDFFTKLPTIVEMARKDHWSKATIEGVENRGVVVGGSTEDSAANQWGWDIDGQVESFWIDVPAETKLALRNMKLKGSYNLTWWYIAIGFGSVSLGAGVLCFVVRRKWKAPPAASRPPDAEAQGV